ncbi:uncharacterized protein L969DRAFT_246836 [Mixia osmundae IAM 14324]|uniref:THO complex subunit 2 n=1 Tax=Mixia osmundae (strain CBS 9802 / IAM 14324 / JCM 22182 / KY 12970) TaxID=764103 RepID=G7E1I7_MIXOS|nr:uncharacterized protein L969DRAFT_246836 [Mixia osmundae IAM 14324]KEI36650.1 hypothetical protein L969DRAFT_246836 [Mixia osmundae IAM 14324]GAA96697.1 hypothetical protein E5Q_03368 [Mixia osmundae IAM 14324]
MPSDGLPEELLRSGTDDAIEAALVQLLRRLTQADSAAQPAPASTARTDETSQSSARQAWTDALLLLLEQALEDARATPVSVERPLDRLPGLLARTVIACEMTDFAASSAGQALVDVVCTLDHLLESALARQKSYMARPENAIDLEGTAQAQSSSTIYAADKAQLARLTRQCLDASLISLDALKLSTDSAAKENLLNSSGLFDSAQQLLWARAETRLRTTLLYKQKKFNLLREESEGYAKLVVELTESMGPPADSQTASPTESASEMLARARTVTRNVQGLIGFFDLDPNRTLDVMLDVFGDNLVHHSDFFRALLKLSPWHTHAAQYHDEPPPQNVPSVAKTPLRPKGSALCAQLMGFKFQYYQSPLAPSDPPERLYMLTAILIKDGIIRLADLYPYLSPDMSAADKMRSDYENALLDRVDAAKSNALATAAALVDDALPSRSNDANSKDAAIVTPVALPVREPPNEKLGLLRALLSIGCLEEGLFILADWPLFINAHPDVADLLLRIMDYLVMPAYRSLPLQANRVDRSASLATPKSRYSLSERRLIPPHGLVSYALSVRAINNPPKPGQESVFFMPDWSKMLRQAASAENVLDTLWDLLKLVGIQLGRHLTFATRLCRIARYCLTHENSMSEAPRAQWLTVIRTSLLPALALSDTNQAFVAEVWMVLQVFSYEQRFSFYGEWRDRSYKTILELRVKRAEAESQTKALLRRLSTENVKQFGRSLAKLAHSSACILFPIALGQVQSYDNLIAPVVDATRYMTDLEYDVLTFSLIDALADPLKARTKTDGTNVSLWLQGLANFTGNLYKKWSRCDPAPVLRYIACQLGEGNPKDLIILREMVTQMTGIETQLDLTDGQVVALGGGPRLRQEVLQPSTLTVTRTAPKRSATRLLRTLQSHRLDLVMMLHIALQRQACIYGEGNDSAHLKYLGSLFDQCHTVLLQYAEFLQTQLNEAEYAELLPSLDALVGTFDIDMSMALSLLRPKLTHLLALAAPRLPEVAADVSMQLEESSTSVAPVVNGDTAEGLTTPLSAGKTLDQTNDDATMADADNASVSVNSIPAIAEPSEAIWQESLQPFILEAERHLPRTAKAFFAPGFYVTFWQLSMFDIIVPTASYEREITRLSTMGNDAEPKTQARLTEIANGLLAEVGEQNAWRKRTMKRLNTEKDHWFKSMHKRQKSQTAHQLMQMCILPRARMSPIDAVFCAQFIRTAHSLGSRQFPTLSLYDRIFGEWLAGEIWTCTEYEVRNYSRFLAEVLGTLSNWFRDANLFAKEATGTDLPEDRKITGFDLHPGKPLPHNDFRTVFNKWQNRIQSSCKACLLSGDYMRIRNALIVLNKLSPSFPYNLNLCQLMLADVTELSKTETREDLKIQAAGYSAVLQKAQQIMSSREAKAPIPVRPAATPQPPISGTPSAQNTVAMTAGLSSESRADEFAKPAVSGDMQASVAMPSVEQRAVNGKATDPADDRSTPFSQLTDSADPSRSQPVSATSEKASYMPRDREAALRKASENMGNARTGRAAPDNGLPNGSGAPQEDAKQDRASYNGTPGTSSRAASPRSTHGDNTVRAVPTGPRHSRTESDAASEASYARARSSRQPPAAPAEPGKHERARLGQDEIKPAEPSSRAQYISNGRSGMHRSAADGDFDSQRNGASKSSRTDWDSDRDRARRRGRDLEADDGRHASASSTYRRPASRDDRQRDADDGEPPPPDKRQRMSELAARQQELRSSRRVDSARDSPKERSDRDIEASTANAAAEREPGRVSIRGQATNRIAAPLFPPTSLADASGQSRPDRSASSRRVSEQSARSQRRATPTERASNSESNALRLNDRLSEPGQTTSRTSRLHSRSPTNDSARRTRRRA